MYISFLQTHTVFDLLSFLVGGFHPLYIMYQELSKDPIQKYSIVLLGTDSRENKCDAMFT